MLYEDGAAQRIDLARLQSLSIRSAPWTASDTSPLSTLANPLPGSRTTRQPLLVEEFN
jgi:hypothetical protein